jgi:hypothetical protein
MLNTLATCVIVFSAGTNGNWQEKEMHEFAHAIGWEHPQKANAFGKAFPVPMSYQRLYHQWKAGKFEPGCNLVVHRVSVAKAKQLCDGHFGCQWFE